MSSSSSSASGGLCDDALVEILVRLPSKSVLSCRAVCKAWHRVTTDVSFLAAHAGRRPRELVVLTAGSYTVGAVPLSPLLDDDTTAPPRYLCDPSMLDSRNDEWTIGSCGGLLVLASLHGLLLLEQRTGLYIVCNPTTRQWTNLPMLCPRPCSTAFPCGFYYHTSSGEYRLLCHGKRACNDDDDDEYYYYYYYILSAGSAVPRRLPQRAPSPADRRPCLVGLSYERPPVVHRGVLYWLQRHPEATRTGKMLAFRTDSETFRLMPRPPVPDDTQATLLELDDGTLCALAMRPGGTPMEIWQQHDDDDDEPTWTLHHRVVMPPPYPPPDSGGRRSFFLLGGAISAGAGTILVRGNPLSGVVRLCHLKDRTVKQMKMHSKPTLLPFTESLVPHDFFHQVSLTSLA